MELLVVTVIVVALAAITFNVASSMRRSAASINCIRDLRQWAMVFGLCAQDNGYYIVNNRWMPISTNAASESIYVKYWDESDIWSARAKHLEMRRCPCYKEGLAASGNPAPTYLINKTLATTPTVPNESNRAHPAAIYEPSRRIMFIDGDVGHSGEITSSSIEVLNKNITSAAEVHGGKVNMVMADLSQRTMTVKELRDKWTVLIEGPPVARGR